MADPFARSSVRIERIPVCAERRTPREDMGMRLREMAEQLERMSPEEIAALLAEDSVDEEP